MSWYISEKLGVIHDETFYEFIQQTKVSQKTPLYIENAPKQTLKLLYLTTLLILVKTLLIKFIKGLMDITKIKKKKRRLSRNDIPVHSIIPSTSVS